MKRRILLLLSIAFLLTGIMPVMAFADSQSTIIKYSVKATVIYVEYDGVQTIQKVSVGSTLKEPAHKEKVGSRFLGWKNKDTGRFWNFEDPVTDHLTLVAQYEEIRDPGHSGSSGNGSSGSSSSGSSSSGGGSHGSISTTTGGPGVISSSSGETVSTDETMTSDETKASNGTVSSGEKAEAVKTEATKVTAEPISDQNPASQTEKYGNGSFTVEVQTENGMADASIGIDQEQWLKSLMESGTITKEERSQVADGGSMKIVLVVENIETSISEESKEEIKKAADGYILGQYMDIRVYKTMLINGAETGREQIHSTGEMLTISVHVPDGMINKDETVLRQYFVFRNHNGAVDILDAQFDDETHMLTFETDQFSEYAIAYKDSAKENAQDTTAAKKDADTDSKEENKINPDQPPKQQKQAVNYVFFFILIIIILFFLLLFKRRKKDQENK